ncbi:uncharacterized protein LOC120174267 [Hibiscus syriacus]|uniref:uncharacterized protein LOC120174267 n=1 Tax=Hibiscus syriacus TaxID=106335 RepID=UPI0019207E02|nr:uncharacterized protein LOC120174267 [Hibiscus syriacus]
MLTVTKIPNHVAVKIALELKKLLIDNNLLDISQYDLEANLFKLMQLARLWVSLCKPVQDDDQISPSESSFGNSCLWNCLCWEVYNSYTTCAKAKLAEADCPTLNRLYGA